MMSTLHSDSSFTQDPYTAPPAHLEMQRLRHDFSRDYQEPVARVTASAVPPRHIGLPYSRINTDPACNESAEFLHRSVRIRHLHNNPDTDQFSGAAREPEKSWLADALNELREIGDEVIEEDLPEIATETRSEAERIIRKLCDHAFAPAIYPTNDGEIAIHFKSPTAPAAVIIELNNDGQGACFSCINGKNRRARYDDSSDLPDAFVTAQLQALAAANGG